MKIVVGSESPHKTGAVLDACTWLQLAARIQGVSVKSSVREQPYGFHEIERGAYHRALSSIELDPGADLYIGVESGIVDTGRKFIDMAVVVVRGPGAAVLSFATSAGIVFPDQYVARARELDCTVGAVFAKYGCPDPTDGTAWLTGGRMTRRKQMTSGVHVALAQALQGPR